MSGKMSRNKGAQYQRDVRNYFTSLGFDVFDPNRAGYDGDDMQIREYPNLSIELKNHATMALPAWLAQSKEQAAKISENHIPVVIHKRKGKTNVGEHYVSMEVDEFIRLLEMLGDNNGNN